MNEQALKRKRRNKMIEQLIKSGIYKVGSFHLYELEYPDIERLFHQMMQRKCTDKKCKGA